MRLCANGTLLATMMIETGGFLALAALMIGLFAWLRADTSRLDKRIDVLDGRLRMVEHGQAKLESLLEGLREAIPRSTPLPTSPCQGGGA